jgi:hypothetical protein
VIHRYGIDKIYGVADWLIDLHHTIDRLNDGKRRCEEMTIERLREACKATYQIQVAYEIARLGNDLRVLAGQDTAESYVQAAAACFGVDPPELERS